MAITWKKIAFDADVISNTLLTTRGDIIYRNATVPARLAKGTEGYVLTMGANDPEWATGGGGVNYTEYEYEADLASSATYTPPAQTFFNLFTGFMGSSYINLEWYDAQDSTWDVKIYELWYKLMLYQSASQRLRAINDSGGALAVGLYGVTWS